MNSRTTIEELQHNQLKLKINSNHSEFAWNYDKTHPHCYHFFHSILGRRQRMIVLLALPLIRSHLTLWLCFFAHTIWTPTTYSIYLEKLWKHWNFSGYTKTCGIIEKNLFSGQVSSGQPWRTEKCWTRAMSKQKKHSQKDLVLTLDLWVEALEYHSQAAWVNH